MQMDFSRYDKHIFPGSHTPEKPKVSICFITYKHEAYIRKSLDAILEQKTNFDFEITNTILILKSGIRKTNLISDTQNQNQKHI